MSQLLIFLISVLTQLGLIADTSTEAMPPDPVPVTTQATADTLRIDVAGDSTACGGMDNTPGYCPELSRLLDAAGVGHTIVPLAVGGTQCSYWSERMTAILAAHPADVVIVGCGINDAAAGTSPAQTQSDLASIADQVHAHGARLVINRLHYASANPPSYEARPALPGQILATNGAITAAFAGFAPSFGPSFSPALADDTRLPALAQFILGDGVHPTAKGYEVMAHNRYRALQAIIPGLSNIGPDCMQIGHAPDEPMPAGIPCLPGSSSPPVAVGSPLKRGEG